MSMALVGAGRGDEQNGARLWRQRGDLRQEVDIHPASDRQAAGQGEPPGQLFGAEFSDQLQHRQRVAAGLVDHAR